MSSATIDTMTGVARHNLSSALPRRRAALLNVAFNYLSLGVTLVSGILLVPVYLQAFDLATYGAWLATGNVVGLVTLLDLGLNLVFAQRLAAAAGANDANLFATLAGAGLAITILSAALVLASGVAIAPWVPGVVHAPPHQSADLRVAFVLAAWGSAAILVQQSLGAVLQAWMMSIATGVANLVSALVGLLSTVAALYAGWGVVALGAGAAVRGATGCLLLTLAVLRTWTARNLPRPRVRRSAVFALARSTAPMFASRLGSALLGNSEAAMISILVNSKAAAVVALTGRAFSCACLLLSPIGSAAFSGITRLRFETPARLTGVVRELLTLTACVAGVLLGVAVILNPGFVGLWVGAQSFGGVTLSVAIAASVAVVTRVSTMSLILTALGRIRETALLSLAEAAVRLGLTVFLIRHLGLIGLPLATIAAAMGVSGWFLARLLRKEMPGDVSRHSMALAGVGPMAIVLAVGAAVAAMLPIATSWAVFVLEAAGIGAAVCLSMLLLNQCAREQSTRLAKSLVRKTRLLPWRA